MELVVYNPLDGDLLSGKYSPSNLPTEGRISGDSAEQGSQYRARYFRDEYFEVLALIETIAHKYGLTLVQMAFRWLWYHSMLNTAIRNGGNDGVIVGASGIGQLQANLSHAEEGTLPSEVLTTLDKAWKICKDDAPDYWQSRPLEYAYNVQKSLFGA